MVGLDVVGGVDDAGALGRMIAHTRATGRAAVAVWREREAYDLLGRFEVSASGQRRYTGGRTVGVRPDDVRIMMALPHRSAIETDDPMALRPEQAMNRCVRGVLNALRNSGLEPFYPGRDTVLLGRRPVGWLALGESEGEGAVFEAGISIGHLPVSAPPPHALRAAVGLAYTGMSWESVSEIDVGTLPPGVELSLDWDVPSAATGRGIVPTMLGRLEAYVGLTDDWRIASVRLAGDVIAPVPTMLALEWALAGLVPLRTTIADAVARVLADPGRWLLGIDGPTDVAAAMVDAIA